MNASRSNSGPRSSSGRPTAPVRATAPVRTGRRVVAAAFAALGLLGAPAPAVAQEVEPLGQDAPFESRRDPQVYALNSSREGEALADEALAARARGRLPTVFAAFAQLLEDYGSQVLPSRFAADGAGHYPHHVGVGPWVAAQLDALADAERAAWIETVRDDAAPLLAFALEFNVEAALLETARRFPRTPFAARAWLAIGDLRLADGRRARASGAWEAARDDASGDPALTAAVEARLASSAELERVDDARVAGEFALPTGPLHHWTAELDPSPFAKSWPAAAPFAVEGTATKDRLFVNTSLSITCFDLLGGDRLWTTPEPEGWDRVSRRDRDELFDAIEHVEARVRPAVVGERVVGALQLPTSSHRAYDYQGITVTKRLPERRLFAFDASTGEPAWNHAPGSGVAPEIEAFSVAAPATVVDGLLLVPLARVEGRIELRLACVDPADGRVVWSTRIVSGQRALNMFNRHEEEFWSAPVTVHGTRALLGTQLGSVACVDVESGAVLWQATYEPIPLPRSSGLWNRAERRRVWRNAAPVVSDGLVFATPTDSEDLLAIDLATGRVEWSRSNRRLAPRRSSDGPIERIDVDALLGAHDGRVLLAGDGLVAWSIGGTGRSPEGELLAPLPRDVVPQAYGFGLGPRTRLVGERLLVPSDGGLFVHALDGARVENEEIDWEDGAIGNVLVANGAAVSVRGDRVSVFLDLELLEARTLARLADDPRDGRALSTIGRLHLRRAELAREAGDTTAALAQHTALRARLEPVLDEVAGLRELYTEAVRAEADLLATSGDARAASDLVRAAADRVERDALVLELLVTWTRLERTRPEGALESALAAVETRVPDTPIPAQELADDPAWAAWLEGRDPFAVDASLWVRVQRAFAAEAAGDATGAVAAWQDCLEYHADALVARDRRLAEVTESALRHWLSTDPDAYAPFERAAREELERARETGDLERLDDLARRYPFAEATVEARALALDLALAERDLLESLRRARNAMADTGLAETERTDTGLGPQAVWTPERRVALALLADASANRSLARAVLTDLARRAPEWRSDDARFDGLGADDLVGVLFGPDAPVALPTFGDRVKLDQSISGPFDVIGRLAEEDGTKLVLHHRNRIERHALDGAGGRSDARFESALRSFPGERQRAFAPEGLVWLSSGSAQANDLESGRRKWRWPPDERNDDGEFVLAQEVAAADGVAALTIYRAGGRHPDAHNALVALELTTGEPMWEVALPEGRWLRPIVADGRITVVAQGLQGRPSRVLSFDLVSGGDRVDFELESALDSRDGERLRVREGRLIVPLFADAALSAFDLATGERAWRRDLADEGRSSLLFAVLEHAGALYTISAPVDLTGDAGAALHQVEPRTGGARLVERFDAGEEFVGVPRGAWIELDAPWLFALWHDDASPEARVSGIALPAGRRWTQRLRLASKLLGDVSRATPAVSEEFAAIVWTTIDPASRRPDPPRLGFFDLETGLKTTHRLLTAEFADFDTIELVGHGEVLWLVCSDQNDGASERIELWK